eukprot:54304-Eustigmatos_ZCMA.PRE.1
MAHQRTVDIPFLKQGQQHEIWGCESWVRAFRSVARANNWNIAAQMRQLQLCFLYNEPVALWELSQDAFPNVDAFYTAFKAHFWPRDWEDQIKRDIKTRKQGVTLDERGNY